MCKLDAQEYHHLCKYGVVITDWLPYIGAPPCRLFALCCGSPLLQTLHLLGFNFCQIILLSYARHYVAVFLSPGNHSISEGPNSIGVTFQALMTVDKVWGVSWISSPDSVNSNGEQRASSTRAEGHEPWGLRWQKGTNFFER